MRFLRDRPVGLFVFSSIARKGNLEEIAPTSLVTPPRCPQGNTESKEKIYTTLFLKPHNETVEPLPPPPFSPLAMETG